MCLGGGGVCTVITIFLNSSSCVCGGGVAHLYQTFTWMCSNVGPQHDMPNQTSDFRLYTHSWGGVGRALVQFMHFLADFAMLAVVATSGTPWYPL